MKRKDRLAKSTIILATIVVLGAVLFFVSDRIQNQEKAIDYGSFKDKKVSQGVYEDVYYLQTKYKDQLFKVISDVPIGGSGDHRVICAKDGALDKMSDRDIQNIQSPYSPKYPVNTVLELYLDKASYSKMIDGYTEFDLTATVTTVLLTEGGQYGYGNTYVEYTRPSEPDALVKNFLITIQEDDEIMPPEIYELDFSDEKLVKYIQENRFHKWQKSS